MSRLKSFVALPAIGMFALAILAGGASQAAAAETSTITIHHRLCPTDKTVTDVFTDCHDGLAGQSFEFTIDSSDGEQTFATDAATGNGSVTVTAGEVEIWGGVPGEFATTYVYCSQDQVALDLATTTKGVSFEAPAGEVVCDWYNTPIDLSGGASDDDDQDDEDDDDTVTTLPNTGVGPAGGASATGLIALATGLGTLGAAVTLPRRRRA